MKIFARTLLLGAAIAIAGGYFGPTFALTSPEALAAWDHHLVWDSRDQGYWCVGSPIDCS